MKDKVWAYIIGSGLVLFTIHNPDQPLLGYAFLPAIGLVLSLLGIAVILHDNITEVTLGSRAIWIPLAVISASIAGSGIIKLFNPPTDNIRLCIEFALATTLFGLYLFGVYLAGRVLGQRLFVPFAWAVVITAIGCAVMGFADIGDKSGGIIYSENYDIAAGLLIFGTLASIWQRQWTLTAVALVGLFFTGAEEGLFACGVILIAVLVRRDWSKKMLLPACTVIAIALICWPSGITRELYSPTILKLNQATQAATMSVETPEEYLDRDILLNEATSFRWLEHWRIPAIKPLGYGYNITGFYWGIPHNVPLIIIHQVGIVAAIAWLWVTGFCLFRTRWRYAFIGILALCVFDHYIWTQAAPWWWCLVGVASASGLHRDYIFKEAI